MEFVSSWMALEKNFTHIFVDDNDYDNVYLNLLHYISIYYITHFI